MMELPIQTRQCLEHCGPGGHLADMSQNVGNAKSGIPQHSRRCCGICAAPRHLSPNSQAARLLRARALHGVCGRVCPCIR